VDTLKAVMAISLSLALLRSLIAKTNAPQENVKRNDVWSDKAQPSLRKKLLVRNNPAITTQLGQR
jgi:hypothetical protein